MATPLLNLSSVVFIASPKITSRPLTSSLQEWLVYSALDNVRLAMDHVRFHISNSGTLFLSVDAAIWHCTRSADAVTFCSCAGVMEPPAVSSTLARRS